MADFRPLRGVRYNPQTVSDLSRVTAPPYDKIDAEQARRYRALDPHNIVHLTLPEGEGQGRYERARQLFFRWLEEKVLCLEDRPCFYLYQQEFPFGEETLSRTGWLGALRAVPYEEQVVMPHEYTLKGPIEDRLSLLKATGVHFESIFLLYPDTQGWTGRQVAELTRGAPVLEVVDEERVTHRLWPVSDPHRLQDIKGFFADRRLFIADGHHRYETTLHYAATQPEGPGKFLQVALFWADDPGLVILPTHRGVGGLPRERFEGLPEKLDDLFHVIPWRRSLPELLREMGSSGGATFGMALGPGLYLLKPRDNGRLYQVMPGRGEHPADRLDVAILHRAILEGVLGITEEMVHSEKVIEYHRDPDRLGDRVQAGELQVGFFVNPTPARQVLEVASARGRMPQKSTDFYPKLRSGLVLYWTGAEGVLG